MYILPILSVLIGGALTLVGIRYKVALDNASQEKRTSAIISAEWADIARHYNRNIERIKSMRYELTENAKWPERVHVEKLKWPEDTYIFDTISVQFSTAKTVAEIYKMRLRLRNANLDTDAAMRAFLSARSDLFLPALDFVENRHARVEDLALRFIGKVKDRTPQSDKEAAEKSRQAGDMLFFDKPLLN